MNNLSQNTPFIVSLNSDKVLEYYRDRPLTESQVKDLTAMDEKLEQGIEIADKFIQSPSQQEKAIFIANQLASALQEENDKALALSCAYLATRYPSLKQLRISTRDNQLSIELINDKEYTQQSPVKFVRKSEL